ncbi:MAG TPA: acetoacetate decarboxylase family protein [Microthrixaceae bacterium]|nr:acetoacetate decarboxylase family protein [Microthrixaceae bacterium]
MTDAKAAGSIAAGSGAGSDKPPADDTAAHKPGDLLGLPKLIIRYFTDPGAIAALLPPGLETYGDPIVQVNFYCVPVHEEPEHGVSTKIPARFEGVDGWYCLGIGIDQESAIFISRETNGQPKFPCNVTYDRLGDQILASATHQGATYLTYRGTSSGATIPDPIERTDHEWWIKYSRAVGGAEGYDLEPQVVRVTTSGVPVRSEGLAGELVINESVWDPYFALLPRRSPATAELVTTRHTGRSITAAGTLDPVGFLPFADTIGGSRWPGDRGAPRRPPLAPGGAS